MLIKSLSLKDFKCFEQVDIDFGKITLLTGANSSGKSSLIYALLGIMQSKYFPQYFALNGELINMGGFDEVLRKKAESENFNVEIVFKLENSRNVTVSTSWIQKKDSDLPMLNEIKIFGEYFKNFKIWLENGKHHVDIIETIGEYSTYPTKDILELKENNKDIVIESYKDVKKTIEITGVIDEPFEHFFNRCLSIFNKRFIFFNLDNEYNDINFNYIGSFRLPPVRTYYQKPKAGKVGVNGEGYIDQIIEWEESDREMFDELIKTVTEIGLFKSVQANKMKGGRFELNVQVNENSELASLTDVGFGISQFLPIIVADLQMYFESCFVISQPEIHLHPKIQASFADYLCKKVNEIAEESGNILFDIEIDKQYIVETHSEYLINRMRLLIVKGELKPEDVKLYYMENDGIKTTTYAIELTTDGQIKNAPQGFFDTYEMDVMDIALYASA